MYTCGSCVEETRLPSTATRWLFTAAFRSSLCGTGSLESSDTWCGVAIQPDRSLAAKFKSPSHMTWGKDGDVGEKGEKEG